jgi:AcrR family transcriptional regulator
MDSRRSATHPDPAPRAKRNGGALPSRERIHRAALTRFARYGYDAVSLQQIADDVGLHKSSLFHHYPSKSALLEAVFDTVMQGILARVRPLQTDEPPSAQTLLEVALALADHFCDEPQAARLLLALMTSPDDSEMRRQASDGLEFYQVVASYLDRARQANIVGPIKIRQTIPNLIGLTLVYPAIAHDLAEVVGKDPLSASAREARKAELERTIRALLLLA